MSRGGVYVVKKKKKKVTNKTNYKWHILKTFFFRLSIFKFDVLINVNLDILSRKNKQTTGLIFSPPELHPDSEEKYCIEAAFRPSNSGDKKMQK